MSAKRQFKKRKERIASLFCWSWRDGPPVFQNLNNASSKCYPKILMILKFDEQLNKQSIKTRKSDKCDPKLKQTDVEEQWAQKKRRKK